MTTFLAIGLVGLVLLALSFVLGDLLDGVLDGVFDAFAGDVFSTAVIGGFVSAFGFGGALAQGAGAPALVAVPVGVAAGVAFGWLASWLTGLVKGGGSDGTPSPEDALGRDATVVTGIPADGFGVVRVLVGGHVLRLNAKADLPLEAGADVHVTSVLSPTAVTVSPMWQSDLGELPPS